MQATFRFLRNPIKSIPIISPIHFLAIVDPRALWYEKWMISQLGRAQVIDAMQKSNALPVFVEFFTYYALNELPKFKPASVKDDIRVEDVDQFESDTNVIGLLDLEYLHFLHLTVFIAKMVDCNAGRACFPFKLDKMKFENEGQLLAQSNYFLIK